MEEENKKNIDINTIKAIRELIASFQIMPTQRTEDKDSFASFTGGLRNNWMFVIATFTFVAWLINSNSNIRTVNLTQDTQIAQSAQAIVNLNNDYQTNKNKVESKFEQTDGVSAEILLKLTSIQKDIDSIRANEK